MATATLYICPFILGAEHPRHSGRTSKPPCVLNIRQGILDKIIKKTRSASPPVMVETRSRVMVSASTLLLGFCFLRRLLHLGLLHFGLLGACRSRLCGVCGQGGRSADTDRQAEQCGNECRGHLSHGTLLWLVDGKCLRRRSKIS